MSPWQAAQPGDHISLIDTPSLVLDLDAFERNLARMVTALQGSKVRLRAHAKSHKCPKIALRQIALGAVGICCQKLSEAAVFVQAGVQDILITNEVMGDAKLRHLAPLARCARIGVLVDHPQQLQALAATAKSHAVSLDVYIEVNVGSDRCGVANQKVKNFLHQKPLNKKCEPEPVFTAAHRALQLATKPRHDLLGCRPVRRTN